MNIIDMHCDALLKLWQSKGTASFVDAPELDVNMLKLKKGKVKVQAFAVWVDPSINTLHQFDVALEQVRLFHEEILQKNDEIKHMKDWSELDSLKEDEIGAILTLEGVGPIGNDISKLQILYELGVRLVGLTWNSANLAADGALEPRGAGLTTFGKEIVRFNNDRQIITDVSHLSERAFWDVMELASYPMASHSNTKHHCDHPRNLSDSQARAMFERGGLVHVVYHPPFVKKDGNATIQDLIKHIEHLCALGGVKQIGLGSDFDGIDEKISGLNHAGETQNLINELLKHFSEEEVRGFAFENFLRHRPKN
ncbi:dipeptidase [Robertmurraya kyonggiensis]|uniref:Membrane dipeptidase n=1 Tax=Robertmurraya kyonggiensis TaxID=1037680 RepID=A0A4U1D8B3_9BACI|nr:dipeptidase [Robertmurraya kyonggiensis]TKC18805.1 membrane dipeptidase [Robertmurraya kyonggiensis]